ncbi:MAG: D-sedoheptulose 7-phosphate isomerase [Bacteroidales bacterium]|nr:D-sedoheptulose 7-phosphate isomerase [Bacteroidales bacterium]
MKDIIIASIRESIFVKTKVLEDEYLLQTIGESARQLINCFESGGKALFCGNGGSAADAQHLAAELSGRFNYDREPLNAEALHVNSSYITAVANDYSFDEVYARMVRGTGKEGDILIGLSTSGNSRNVIRAFGEAKLKKMKTIAFTGATGGKLASFSDFLLKVPSTETPRIQEAHILIGHIICQIVESGLFPKGK